MDPLAIGLIQPQKTRDTHVQAGGEPDDRKISQSAYGVIAQPTGLPTAGAPIRRGDGAGVEDREIAGVCGVVDG